MNKRLKDALNKRFKEFQNCLQIVTFILQEIMIKPMLGKQMGSIKKKKRIHRLKVSLMKKALI